MGFPFEHGLHATLMTMRLADLLGVDSETASQTYYACLLMYSGCTTDAEVAIQIFGGGMTKNVTYRQFGSATETLKGVVRAFPSPDSSPLAGPPRSHGDSQRRRDTESHTSPRCARWRRCSPSG